MAESPAISSSERGAALLTVLLLVAVIGALTATALERLRLSTALAANSAAMEQARGYAVGVEALLLLGVEEMLAAGGGQLPVEVGASGFTRQIPLPDGGLARAVVRDGANCFNVNSVAAGAHPARLVPRPAGVAQFRALLQLLNVPGQTAATIASGAGDWVDADGEAQASGGEDALYAGRGYRVGNTLFADASELRALAAMTPDIYARVRPWLCALPTTDMSPVNINTLRPDQAPLLAMLAPDRLSVSEAQRVIASRPPSGWSSTSEFLTASRLAGQAPAELENQVQLGSRWFVADILVGRDNVELEQRILVDARRRPARVIARTYG